MRASGRGLKKRTEHNNRAGQQPRLSLEQGCHYLGRVPATEEQSHTPCMKAQNGSQALRHAQGVARQALPRFKDTHLQGDDPRTHMWMEVCENEDDTETEGPGLTGRRSKRGVTRGSETTLKGARPLKPWEAVHRGFPGRSYLSNEVLEAAPWDAGVTLLEGLR